MRVPPNCRILCSGDITLKYFESLPNCPTRLLQNAGSVKNIPPIESTGSLKKSILIAPEGTKLASLEQLKLGIDLAQNFRNLNFIIRLHPAFKSDSDLNSLQIPKNLRVSRSTLALDFAESNICIFRTSAVGIEAGALGILPIYYSENSEELNPLFLFALDRLSFGSSEAIKNYFFNTENSFEFTRSMQNEFKKYFMKLNLAIFN